MKGKISFSIQNRHIAFKFELERNVTILTGDSGTGKTKLINMVRMFSREGKASGITLKCAYPCVVLEGNSWEAILQKTERSIVFVEESTSFLKSRDFANAIQKTDNYFVLVTREPLSQIPYSIESIKEIIKNDRKPKIERIYKNISVKNIASFPYEVVLVEDAKAGFMFFSKASEKYELRCYSAKGKSNILPELRKCNSDRILVIADGAALGPEIRELMRFKELSGIKIDFFLPESFEWLILKSEIFSNNEHVKEVLSNPVDHIESREYFSWERFFTQLLVDETKDKEKLRYPKNKSKLPSGYLTEANMERILNAMRR